MNFLKSKLTAYKQTGKSKEQVLSAKENKQKKRTVFQFIKKWDKQRVQILKRHLQFIEKILENLQVRVKNSQAYLITIEGIMKARLRELETYKNNSLNNSTFVLMNNHQPGYEESYDVLKQLVIFQSQKQDKVNKKYKKLKEIFAELCDFKNQELDSNISLNNTSQKNISSGRNKSQTSIEDQQLQNINLDESSVAMLKSNVRYLIDCELPDIIQETIKFCQSINRAYHEGSPSNPQQDLYILISKFLNASQKQVQKHRQIARQLLNLNKDFILRQKKRNSKIKHTLSQWVKHDENANQILIRQLQKQGNQSLIQDYYNMDDMISSSSKQIIEVGLEEYFLHISIRPFQNAEDLVLFRCDAFYNKKIESEVLITVDGFCHLRKLNNLDPDFSFCLRKQIYVVQEEEFVFKVEKIEKKFMKSPEKQFEFCLEFNMAEDIEKFIDILQDSQWVNLKCL